MKFKVGQLITIKHSSGDYKFFVDGECTIIKCCFGSRIDPPLYTMDSSELVVDRYENTYYISNKDGIIKEFSEREILEKINMLGYAFWKYDSFPFVLGGEFNKINDNGLVYVPSYQSWFRPVAIVSLEAGKEIKNKLNKLKDQYLEDQEKLKLKHSALIKKTFTLASVLPSDWEEINQ